ncbi:GNAT family N-acetyltransferase [Streptomyces sp. Qhu-G9]|uniref:GNAT family N-acetyltransferase n=1 Tax=Streptomyces sp. Qhu-G9 TaxID=3452799 RepID=UPI0022AC178C|nr:GNAT family N-acetyltransferase [Streptomyces aurantiacus]WAU84480.1 GNAT family N-acetyltransferase [Streptomyces aurantiacus]
MPPTDASTDAGTAPRTDARSRTSPGADSEDTLDLRLPDEFLALFAERTGAAGTLEGAGDAGATTERSEQSGGEPGPWARGPGRCEARPTPAAPAGDDLLDRVGDWGPTATAAGVLQLVPVHIDRDLPLIGRWMDDPAVAAFWELSGPGTATEDHLRAQLGGDGRSVPCLGMLDGTPMSYWEIYRADLDPLARHYPARLHDTGIHLLIGGVTNRGRGLGTILLRAVSDLVLDRRPSCARVVAEPDLRNTPSVSAFLSAGFRFSAEVDLPDKKAALMVRDRALRDLL